eukprot:INCI19162.1.p1 GENE.INCI19162.1~~INCI19162.1.p1  ORF type:complete len:268 (-),score=35.93 INCI19162.1:417-1220(-)
MRLRLVRCVIWLQLVSLGAHAQCDTADISLSAGMTVSPQGTIAAGEFVTVSCSPGYSYKYETTLGDCDWRVHPYTEVGWNGITEAACTGSSFCYDVAVDSKYACYIVTDSSALPSDSTEFVASSTSISASTPRLEDVFLTRMSQTVQHQQTTITEAVANISRNTQTIAAAVQATSNLNSSLETLRASSPIVVSSEFGRNSYFARVFNASDSVQNKVIGDHNVAIGGTRNAITGSAAVVGGGWKNVVLAQYGSVLGGKQNSVVSNYAT